MRIFQWDRRRRNSSRGAIKFVDADVLFKVRNYKWRILRTFAVGIERSLFHLLLH